MESILTSLGEIATGIGEFFANLFTSISALFYDPTPTTGGLTLLTYLVLIAVVIRLALWVINFVLRLFKFR